MKTKLSFFVVSFVSSLFIACGEKEQEITVQSIALSQPSAELKIGETLNLKATVSPSNATYDGITWTSTRTTIATVSGSGLVSALAEGNTTITAMAGGKTASCSVTVVKGVVAVSSISLNKDSIELVEGDSETLTATVSPNDATDKTVSWTSSNTGVATVKDGTITAIKEGEATITAKAGEKTASCKVIVAKKVIPVESIELNKTELELVEGDSETLTATISPEDATNKTVSWSSSNTRVATVKDGTITAVKEGEVTITAKAGEKTASCKVVVAKKVIPVESIVLDKDELELIIGESVTLVATVRPDDATDKSVFWTSSDETIASVSNSGIVSAKAAGEAIVTAKAGDKSVSCAIYVKNDPKEEAIVFADSKLKACLISVFDKNNDGELSYNEAAAVSSGKELMEAFRGIKTFKSFDEFQFFVGITKVPDNMFDGWGALVSITIPKSVTKLGYSSFGNCSALTNVSILGPVESITQRAFYEDKKLTTINIPESVTSISSGAFDGCTSLSSIDLPKSLTSIQSTAFSRCSSLSSITIPGGVSSIGASSFWQCVSLTNIILSEGVKSIEESAFADCNKLSLVSLPNSLTKIGFGAFYQCSNLSDITIPNSVTEIWDVAFLGTGLTSVVVSKNVIHLGNGAFVNPNLVSLIVEPDNPIYDSRNGCNAIIETDSNVLICGCQTTVIPDSVTSIGPSAFEGINNKSSFIIPESVTSIGGGAFARCTGLISIILPRGLTEIGFGAFTECSSLTEIEIPEHVDTIGGGAFSNCPSLSSIVVLPSIPPILEGEGVFTKTNDAPIYVPSGSIDAYKSAKYWSQYANRIQAISL